MTTTTITTIQNVAKFEIKLNVVQMMTMVTITINDRYYIVIIIYVFTNFTHYIGNQHNTWYEFVINIRTYTHIYIHSIHGTYTHVRVFEI